VVSMVDVLGKPANDLFTWADMRLVGDPDALEAVLQGWSGSGVKNQLRRLVNIRQPRQNNHLRRTVQAGTGRARGSGTGDLRDDGAEANERRYQDAPGSPKRGRDGGRNQNRGSGYYN